jgi:hypothetical protein
LKAEALGETKDGAVHAAKHAMLLKSMASNRQKIAMVRTACEGFDQLDSVPSSLQLSDSGDPLVTRTPSPTSLVYANLETTALPSICYLCRSTAISSALR